jgi:hypothetical protein
MHAAYAFDPNASIASRTMTQARRMGFTTSPTSIGRNTITEKLCYVDIIHGIQEKIAKSKPEDPVAFRKAVTMDHGARAAARCLCKVSTS